LKTPPPVFTGRKLRPAGIGIEAPGQRSQTVASTYSLLRGCEGRTFSSMLWSANLTVSFWAYIIPT